MRKIATCPESLLEKYRKNHVTDTMKFFTVVKLKSEDLGKKFKMKNKIYFLEGRMDEKTLVIRENESGSLWAVDHFIVQKFLRENPLTEK